MDILAHSRQLLASLQPLSFASTGKSISRVSSEAFVQLHDHLFFMANNPNTTEDIRVRCIETMLGLAVACGSLSFLLAALRSMLFPVSPVRELSVLPFMHKLSNMRRQLPLDLPGPLNLDTKFTVTELFAMTEAAVASDGTYVYIHCRLGLYKLGTGKNNTTPGIVYCSIKGYRGSERSSLACVGDRLYYRSAAIAPAALLVLRTDTLTLEGEIMPDGSGSIKSANNTHFSFGIPSAHRHGMRHHHGADPSSKPSEEDSKDMAEKAKEKEMAASSALDDEKKEDEKSTEDAESKKKTDAGEEDTLALSDPAMALKKKMQQQMSAVSQPLFNQQDVVTVRTSSDPHSLGDADSKHTGEEGKSTPDAASEEMVQVMGQESSGDATVAETSNTDSSSKPTDSKFSPVISDGRFLYVIVPRKLAPSEKKELGELQHLEVHVLDGKQKLKECHMVNLMSFTPSLVSRVLSFAPPESGGSSDGPQDAPVNNMNVDLFGAAGNNWGSTNPWPDQQQR